MFLRIGVAHGVTRKQPGGWRRWQRIVGVVRVKHTFVWDAASTGMRCGTIVVHFFSLFCNVVLQAEARLPFALNDEQAPSEIDAAEGGGNRRLLDNSTPYSTGLGKKLDGVYACPDAHDFLGALNDLRAVLAAAPVTWSTELADEVAQRLSNFSLHNMCNAYSWSSGLDVLTLTGNPNLLFPDFLTTNNWAAPCVEAALAFFKAIRSLIASPEVQATYLNESMNGNNVFLTNWPTTMYSPVAWNGTKEVGCAVGACADMGSHFYKVFCLTNPLVAEEFGPNYAMLLAELQPVAGNVCPYFVSTNWSYSVLEAAADANLTVDELLCYHNQLPRGFPYASFDQLGKQFVTVLVPCQEDAPDEVEVEQCAFHQLYEGRCPARYLVIPNDTLSSIAWSFSGVTAAQLCCYNNLSDCQQLSLFQEIHIPCPEQLVGTPCEHLTGNASAHTYSCPDKDASLQAMNDMRDRFGLGPLLWDQNLELAARDYLGYALGVAGPECGFSDMNAQMRAALPTAIFSLSNDRPTSPVDTYSCVPYIMSLAEGTMFSRSSITHVACAVGVCEQPQRMPGYMVACIPRPNVFSWLVGDPGEFNYTTPPLEGVCPFPYTITSQDDLGSVAQRFNVTPEEIICQYNQLGSPYLHHTIAIPCPDSSPVKYGWLDNEAGVSCPTLSLLQSSCPARYIVVPQWYPSTPSSVVSYFGSGISTSALCCFNNISDCTATLPFGMQLEVPCAGQLDERGCGNLEGVLDALEEGTGHHCFDANETLAGVNEMRAAFGAPPVSWDAELEFTMLTLLNEKTAQSGCPPDVDGVGVMLVHYQSYSSRCILAANSKMAGVDNITFDEQGRPALDPIWGFDPLEILWAGVDRMACAIATCGNNMTLEWEAMVYCAYLPNVNLYGWFDDSWAVAANLQPRRESCPRPYRMQTGDSFQSVAQGFNLMLAELVCYHDQIGDPGTAMPGFDMVIPCPGAAPRDCAAMRVYAGTCPVLFPWARAEPWNLQQLCVRYNLSLQALCCYNGVNQQDCPERLERFGQPLEIPCLQQLLGGPCEALLNSVSPSPKNLVSNTLSKSGSNGVAIGVAVAAGAVLLLLLGLGLLVWGYRVHMNRVKQIPLAELLGISKTSDFPSELQTFYIGQIMSPLQPLQTDTRAKHSRTVEQSLLSDVSGPSHCSSPNLPLDSVGPSACHNAHLVPVEDVKVSMEGGHPVELGQGAFAKVYEGSLGAERIPVALKVLKHNAQPPDTMKRLLQEMALLRHCHSKYIVTFHGTCFTNDNVVLVLELMSHGDLFHALNGRNKQDYMWYNRGAHLMLDIAHGIEYLHSQRIVHRDIKSLNVLLTDDDCAKIGDMGMSKFLVNSLLSEDNMLGTLAYAAPEVINDNSISNKVDVYAAGVVLWELVTGELPIRGELRKPRVPEECPADVVSLINTCLSLDPSARPTATKLREIVELMVKQMVVEMEGRVDKYLRVP